MVWKKIDIIIIFGTTGMLILAFSIILLSVVYHRKALRKQQKIESLIKDQNRITQK